MGITVHMLEKSAATSHLTSYLLDCRRFAGQHTGENTGSCFSEVTAQFGISDKINYILTDNASNMRAAFAVQFSAECCSEDAEVEITDDDNI